MKAFFTGLLTLAVVIIFGFVIYKACAPNICLASSHSDSALATASNTSSDEDIDGESFDDEGLRDEIVRLAQSENVSRDGITDAICGNGRRELQERCDDGNTTDGDGCSASCGLEDSGSADDKDSCKDDAVIGDRVWHDLNGNSIQDAGEPGISGVTVKVIDGNDKKYQTTDASGAYKFKNLCNKVTVVVAYETLPEGCYQTHDRDGKFDHSYTRNLGEDGLYGKADFGYKCPLTLSAERKISPATGASGDALLAMIMLSAAISTYLLVMRIRS